jgi:hypothetical protein
MEEGGKEESMVCLYGDRVNDCEGGRVRLGG